MSTLSGEIDAKILYWGLDHSGKTANLGFIRDKLRSDHRGDLKTFQFGETNYQILPIELGQIKGCATRFKIYSLPGTKESKPVRSELAAQALGIVFVVDAQKNKLDQNIALYEEILELIETNDLVDRDFPVIIQYNKLDLPTALGIDELEEKLNTEGFPYFKAVANQGTGVLQTLSSISKSVIRYLRQGGRSIQSGDTNLTDDAKPEKPSASSNPTSAGKPLASPPLPDIARRDLEFLRTGPSVRQADGSFKVEIYLKDPKTQATYTSYINLITNFDGKKFIFKISDGD